MSERQAAVRGSDVLVGVAAPFGASALWHGVVKSLLDAPMRQRLFQEKPAVFIAPAVIVGAALLLAVLLWNRRRGTSYGLLGTVGFALLLVTVFFVAR